MPNALHGRMVELFGEANEAQAKIASVPTPTVDQFICKRTADGWEFKRPPLTQSQIGAGLSTFEQMMRDRYPQQVGYDQLADRAAQEVECKRAAIEEMVRPPMPRLEENGSITPRIVHSVLWEMYRGEGACDTAPDLEYVEPAEAFMTEWLSFQASDIEEPPESVKLAWSAPWPPKVGLEFPR